MKTVRAAAKWLDGVGVAALLPGADLVLPSLWEAITGTRAVEWGVERDDGKFEFTPEMARCWQWKDELPSKRLALFSLCVKKNSHSCDTFRSELRLREQVRRSHRDWKRLLSLN